MTIRNVGLALVLIGGGTPSLAQQSRSGPIPTSDWSGFYVGASIGGGFGDGRLRPLRSPVQATSVTTPGGSLCNVNGTLYPVSGPVITAPTLSAPVVITGGNRASSNPSVPGLYFLNARRIDAFNLVNSGAPLTRSFNDFDYQVQPLVLAAGASPTAFQFRSSITGSTSESPACRAVLGADRFLSANPGFDDVGNVSGPAGSAQVSASTTTATAPVGPFAGAAGVDAATLAALAALPGRRINSRTSGVIGGVQAGYNTQIGALVLGVEADLQGTGVHGGSRFDGFSQSNGIDWFGTVRARIGYAVDRFLVYSTGGFAYGDVSLAYALGGLSIGETRLQAGWTAGSGIA